MQMKQFLIYGATGFTGKLTARIAKDRGLTPILAGRNEAKLKAVADTLGFQYRAFELSDFFQARRRARRGRRRAAHRWPVLRHLQADG
jgi:short subunit dehydrogenase-like uncharacterized protein